MLGVGSILGTKRHIEVIFVYGNLMLIWSKANTTLTIRKKSYIPPGLLELVGVSVSRRRGSWSCGADENN